MRPRMMRYLVIGAFLCATLVLSIGTLGCSSDSSEKFVNPQPTPDVEEPPTSSPGRAHDSVVDDPQIPGEQGDI